MSHYTGAVPDTRRAVDWRELAACRKEDPELFFPVGYSAPAMAQTREAKAVCRRCPTVDLCLQWALETGEEHGVFGGLSEDERHALKHGRPRRPARTADALIPPPVKDGSRRTFHSVRDANTQATDDGHVLWTGNRGTSVGGRSYTARQIAFAADRGHLPEGRTATECGVYGCVHPQHISDEAERHQRALAAQLSGAGAGS